jgi:Holliday junction resolvase
MSTKAKGNRQGRVYRKHLVDFNCLGCGQHVVELRSRKTGKYCTPSCLHKHDTKRFGETSPSWKGGRPIWICAQCGEEFSAYHVKGGRDRKYCSWVCSNIANGRSADDMRSRLRYENELMEILEADGFKCLRSAGSRGPVDVFAFNDKELRMIQAKSTKDLNRPGNLSVFREAIALLSKLPSPPGATKHLYVRILRFGWLSQCVDDAPASREPLIKYCGQMMERWDDHAREPRVPIRSITATEWIDTPKLQRFNPKAKA